MYILSTFYFKKNRGARGRKQISTSKTCYEIKKISTSLLSVERGEEQGGSGGGVGGCNFYKKKLKSEMLKFLTTKKVDNFFLCHF